jgi:outer membrane murein-binding lipoprotein Lpp
MRNLYLLLSLSGVVLLCGCNKQAKINSQKIDLLSQKLVELQQDQSKQMALLQAQLTLLAPELNKMNSSYFEKNRDDALFFHTNTLYLLLTIDKQIESQLKVAEADRAVENSQLYGYHTNQMDLTYLCTAQLEGAMTAQESRIEENINAETRRASAALSDALAKQIIQATAPDAAETARRKELTAALAQIQRDLNTIKSELDVTNQPGAP